ncbi:MAG: AAA family ATPase [Polyangiaceae bacterium]|nr:AAA family ATPase [Polyangiaceae bacterium]
MIQTSDNRSRDFADLGKHVTWIKWAEPTAEALRQACLARHSRIAHQPPKLPSVRITALEVSNSKFLGPLALDLNPQYNALIGGRGTGKSTILEYCRWALCDQPPAMTNGTELADFNKRRQALIDNTLIPLGATVDVSFLVDEVPHVVRRKAAGDLVLKIGDAAFQACTEENVRDLLPVRAYSQKQLSAVGARIEELRRFVHAPVRAELAALDEKIASSRIELRSSFDKLQRFRALTAELTAHELERSSLTERIEKLKASLKGLSDEDRAIIARQGVYDAEERIIATFERDAENAKTALSSSIAELTRIPSKVDLKVATENADALKAIRVALDSWAKDARSALGSAEAAFTEPIAAKALGSFFKGITDWRAKRDAHRKQYDEARKRAAAHEETLRQITVLETRLKEINQFTDSKNEQIHRLGFPEQDFSRLRTAWIQMFGKRAELLEGQCAKLSATDNTRLRATLRRAADVEPIAEHLKQVFRGTKIASTKTDALLKAVSDAAAPLDAWHAALSDLLELAWLKIEDEATTTLPSVPRLDAAGLTNREKMALARQLEPSAWLELLLLDLKDLPIFEYRVRDEDFIAFQDASPGQQATALLSILLLQDGPPLVIDQPEDDLNMKIISEVVATLWDAKAHRQIIFASHNANLVVNGDAELVVSCDYRTTTTESGGKIKLTGAIDIPAIKGEITEVMEGGIDAFKLRQQKYGF